MTDTTTARRQLLGLLLDRVERGALLDNERPLLRPLVAAEQADTDRPTPDDGRSLEALRDEIAEALENADYRHDMRRGDLADSVMPVVRSLALQLEHMTGDRDGWWRTAEEQGETIGRRLEAAEAAIVRVRELAERWQYVTGLKDSPRTSLLRALDGPSPTPDDAPTTAACSICGARNVIHQTVTAACLCGDCFLCRCAQDPCTRTGINDPAVSAEAAADRDARVDAAVDTLADEIARQAVEGNGTGQMLGLVGSGIATPVAPASGAVATFQVPCFRCQALVDVPGDATVTPDEPIPGHVCLLLPDDAPAPQCRAEYHGPDGPPGHCRLAQGHDGLHRDAMAGPDGFNWAEIVAVYPLADAPSEQQQ